ncbi:tripartite tricarboxylate transporter substrate-binding protein [Roseomonas sp. HF4]|uniref:tripartite tricarboxylate transporter substrate-binding protein n=1 Tax=Roseomonas sp. HF4 TaxID=2562313 RepID=UPI00197EAE56|nr:tripartite tricarboxylate transporter substrate-binding protein [Roseomonas sp. HF4]
MPEMLNDLAANRIQIAALPLATALPQARAGRIRLLAVTNAVRSPAAPEVPTATEQGFPDYVFEGFVGVFADARQPAAVRAALVEAARAAVAEEAFAGRVRTAGQTPFAGGEADLAARVAAQRTLVEAGLRHVGPA